MSLKTMTAKVGEFWDPIGIFKPVKAFYMHAQSWINSLGWKDQIPQDEQEFWISKWPEIGLIFFPRSIVPKYAVFPIDQGKLTAKIE